jgi:hypothetical protein
METISGSASVAQASVEIEDKINMLLADGKLEEAREMMHKLGVLRRNEKEL